MKELFYQNPYLKEFRAQVIDCIPSKDKYWIELDNTAFYPEGGGQPADHGFLNDVAVEDVFKKDGHIYHLTSKEISGEVIANIDFERRFDHMQQHTGEHIFSGIIERLYGYDNVGFHMGEDFVTLDYSGLLSDEEIAKVEEAANQAIYDNKEVEISYGSNEDLAAAGIRCKKELSGEIRIVRIADVDSCACCGTHCQRTGEVGLIKVISTTVKKDCSRIVIVAGKRAFNYLKQIAWENKQISVLLSAKPTATAKAVEKALNELQKVKYQNGALIRTYFENKLTKLSYQNLYLTFEEVEVNDLRFYLNEVVKTEKARIAGGLTKNVQGYNYIFISKDTDLRTFIKELNQRFKGKGGGNGYQMLGSLQADAEELRTFIEEYFNGRANS